LLFKTEEKRALIQLQHKYCCLHTVFNMFCLDLELFQRLAAYFTTHAINTQDSPGSEMLDWLSCR